MRKRLSHVTLTLAFLAATIGPVNAFASGTTHNNSYNCGGAEECGQSVTGEKVVTVSKPTPVAIIENNVKNYTNQIMRRFGPIRWVADGSFVVRSSSSVPLGETCVQSLTATRDGISLDFHAFQVSEDGENAYWVDQKNSKEGERCFVANVLTINNMEFLYNDMPGVYTINLKTQSYWN